MQKKCSGAPPGNGSAAQYAITTTRSVEITSHVRPRPGQTPWQLDKLACIHMHACTHAHTNKYKYTYICMPLHVRACVCAWNLLHTHVFIKEKKTKRGERKNFKPLMVGISAWFPYYWQAICNICAKVDAMRRHWSSTMKSPICI